MKRIILQVIFPDGHLEAFEKGVNGVKSVDWASSRPQIIWEDGRVEEYVGFSIRIIQLGD